MKSGVGRNSGSFPPRRPAPQPTPPAPTLAATLVTPRSPCLPQPVPASRHLWQRGSLAPPDYTANRRGGLGSSTAGSSTSFDPSAHRIFCRPFHPEDEQLYEREMMLEIARDLVTSARAPFYMYPPLRA